NRNQQQGRVDRSANHLTLELTEPQANVIVLAKDRGQLTLTYNPAGQGSGGLALSNEERVTLYEILGLRPQELATQPFLTEVFKGQGRTLNYFNGKGRKLEGYRGDLVAPDQNQNRNNMALPPSGNGDASPQSPRGDNVPAPTDLPTSRQAPTASRLYPEKS
ncbi:MAG TPA: Flp pilus assembly protein CpaB, partial [Planctomycetaceae bacterium]|nr:Flp pilus assembly protein CpaB [Planctomycetaceae bacterium]